jgi:hypothetical protein
MPVDKKALWQLLKSLTKNDRLATEVTDRLTPMFEAAQRGHLDLASSYHADNDPVAAALSSATQRQIRKIAFVSISNNGRQNGPLTHDELYLLSQGLGVGDSLWQALWDKNRYWLEQGFKKVPRAAGSQAKFEATLRATLGAALETAVWETLKNAGRWKKHRASIWNGIWDCLYYYTGLHAVGETARATKLEPLIKIAAKMLPVSDRKEERNSWIVLIS